MITILTILLVLIIVAVVALVLSGAIIVAWPLMVFLVFGLWLDIKVIKKLIGKGR